MLSIGFDALIQSGLSQLSCPCAMTCTRGRPTSTVGVKQPHGRLHGDPRSWRNQGVQPDWRCARVQNMTSRTVSSRLTDPDDAGFTAAKERRSWRLWSLSYFYWLSWGSWWPCLDLEVPTSNTKRRSLNLRTEKVRSRGKNCLTVLISARTSTGFTQTNSTANIQFTAYGLQWETSKLDFDGYYKSLIVI